MSEHGERDSAHDTSSSAADGSEASNDTRDRVQDFVASPSRAANDTPEKTSIILQDASGSRVGQILFKRAGDGWRCKEIVVNGRFHDSIPFLGGLSDGDVSSIHLEKTYSDTTVRRLVTAFKDMNVPDWACILGLE
jgi:hypothetical protein